MALQLLEIEEMVHITRAWVTRGHPDRVALEAEPALAALLPEVELAHQALLDTHPDRLESLRRRQARRRHKEVRARHDDILRGIWHALHGSIFFTQDAQQLAALRGLKQRLLPDGLGAARTSHPPDLAQTELVTGRLTESDWALLARVPLMDGRSLRHAVEQWLVLTSELERLERARRDEHERPGPGSAVDARDRWIQVVQAVCNVGALVAGEGGALHSVLARVALIEQRAGRRAGRPAGAAEELSEDTFEDVADTLQLQTAELLGQLRLRRRDPASG